MLGEITFFFVAELSKILEMSIKVVYLHLLLLFCRRNCLYIIFILGKTKIENVLSIDEFKKRKVTIWSKRNDIRTKCMLKNYLEDICWKLRKYFVLCCINCRQKNSDKTKDNFLKKVAELTPWYLIIFQITEHF